ncbi:MAG: hypothetical protein MUC63_01960, partial [Planctomycetes bacterium]|nr:hypothetical protein [Planctomycetota bacterium]
MGSMRLHLSADGPRRRIRAARPVPPLGGGTARPDGRPSGRGSRLVRLLPAALLALAAGAAGAPSAPAAEAPAGPAPGAVSLAVSPFLGEKTWRLGIWIPVRVTARNGGPSPAVLDVAVAPNDARTSEARLDSALVRARVQVPPGSTKDFFLYVPPSRFPATLAAVWSLEPGREEFAPILDVRGGFHSPTPVLVVDADPARGQRLSDAVSRASALESVPVPRSIAAAPPSKRESPPGPGDGRGPPQDGETLRQEVSLFQAWLSGPSGLPDRPEGYEAFQVVVLHGLDPGALTAETRRALRDWTVRGGTLLLCPGSDGALLRDPVLVDIHPVRIEGPRREEALAEFATPGGPLPPPRPVHALAGGTTVLRLRDGSPLALAAPAGLGVAVAFASTLEGLEALPRVAAGSLLESVLPEFVDPVTPRFQASGLRPAAPADRPGEPAAGGRSNPHRALRPAFRNFWAGQDESPLWKPRGTGMTISDLMDEEETLTREFHAAMARPVAGTPSIGWISLFLLLLVGAVGPLNYWILRRRGVPALAILTVPALSLPEGAFAVPEFPSPRSRLEQGSE